jgi:hypothetical protein
LWKRNAHLSQDTRLLTFSSMLGKGRYDPNYRNAESRPTRFSIVATFIPTGEQ